MMPLVIKAFSNWDELQHGAVAFIWIAGASLSFSYATASATGAQGIVAGYGANLQRMFVYGMIGGLISIVITILYFWVTVAVLQLRLLHPASQLGILRNLLAALPRYVKGQTGHERDRRRKATGLKR